MTIRFVCACGKHLRAREDLAARRVVCPGCGQLVGVPSMKPTHRDAPVGPLSLTDTYMTRQRDRLIAASQGVSNGATDPSSTGPVPDKSATAVASPRPEALNPGLLRRLALRTPGYRRSSRNLEKHGYQCLTYPFHAFPPLFFLAMFWYSLTLVVLSQLPGVANVLPIPAWLKVYGAPVALVPLFLAAYTCGFLDSVLATTAAGETNPVLIPLRRPDLALRSLATWLICFAAGPMLLVGGSLWYWFHQGDPQLLDWWLIAALNVAGCAYFVLELVAVAVGGSIVRANPYHVARVVRLLDHGVVSVALLGGVIFFAHGFLLVYAAFQFRPHGLRAVTCLALGWGGGLFLMTFLFRWLGIWCHWRRAEA